MKLTNSTEMFFSTQGPSPGVLTLTDEKINYLLRDFLFALSENPGRLVDREVIPAPRFHLPLVLYLGLLIQHVAEATPLLHDRDLKEEKERMNGRRKD